MMYLLGCIFGNSPGVRLIIHGTQIPPKVHPQNYVPFRIIFGNSPDVRLIIQGTQIPPTVHLQNDLPFSM